MENPKLHIAVVSNIVFEPHFIPLIKFQFEQDVKVLPIPYGEHKEVEYRKQLASADLLVVWLNFEAMLPDVWNDLFSHTKTAQAIVDSVSILCEQLQHELLLASNAQMLWFLFEDYYTQVRKVTGSVSLCNGIIEFINYRISEILNNKAVFIDLKRLIAVVGVINGYDSKGKYRWNAPYSKALLEVVVKEIHKQYLAEKGITKKCLILDCDNVFWGGILSEDGIENIKLGESGFGRAYQDFQRFVLSLYYHGVILAVCSKNDLCDLLTVFREHSEMILKEKHIACFQVNWDNKPENIKKIAEILNIGLDSMVFVDDSDFEIESIKQLLPEVTTIKYERDTIYNQLSCFNSKNGIDVETIRQRNNTYKTNEQRIKLKDNSNSFEDYLNTLDMKIDIHPALQVEYSRISELTQRTNKCTNGKRYTVSEIKERISSDAVNLYSVSVSDRFSDLGLVGAFEVEGETLTLFSLSCRALGREVEQKMVEYILNNSQIIKLIFKSTSKNEGIKDLLIQFFPYAKLTNC